MVLNVNDLVTLSSLLDEALELDPMRGEEWLDCLPEQHAHLKEQLWAMLKEHWHPVRAGFMANGPRVNIEPINETTAHPGEVVGPYSLIREIGRGGMGTVWLAERTDASLKRQVALKLPRMAWDAGLTERMSREREIGSLLEHPNIARLYDAGVDARGRPFLALEFIDGTPLDVWCFSNAVPLRDRLRLVVQIARAVAYAHGRLVVHRDIKPSNVLVSVDGQTHLLDFGIAKLLEEAELEAPGLTEQLGRALTPHFASPEQVLGEVITVQSDVYSLGVLAYQLLTENKPYALKRESLAALEAAILEGEPPLASERAGNPATAKALRGDIDAILRKALKRDLAQRYATAGGLADDIERFLANEAVLARPDSRRYRLTKALWRHRVGFGAGAVAASAILGGAGLAAVQAHRANVEAARATQAAARAGVVKDFVVDIFKLNSPNGSAGSDVRQLPVELLLDRGARLIEPRFADQPDLQAELLGVVTRIMLDVNANQFALQYASKQVTALKAANASPADQSRGAVQLVEAMIANSSGQDAERVARASLATTHEPLLRAELRLLLVDLALDTGAFGEASAELGTINQELALGQPQPLLLKARVDYANARLLARMNDFERARPVYEKAIGTALAAQGEPSRLASKFRIEYANRLVLTGHIVEAKAVYKEAFDSMRAGGGPDDVEAALAEAESISNLLETQHRVIGYDEAIAVFARTVAVLRKQGDRLSPRVRADVESTQACVELYFGQVERGHALAVSSSRVLRTFAEDSVAGCLDWAQMMAGQHEDAEIEFRKVIGRFDPTSGCQAGCAVHAYVAMAHNRLMQGRFREARELLNSLPTLGRMKGATAAAAARPELRALVAKARVELEEGHYQAVLELLDGVPDAKYMMNDAGLIRAEAMCRTGRAREVVAVMRLRVAADHGVEVSPWLADNRSRLGLCELLAGNREQAKSMAKLAHRAFELQPRVSPAFRRVLEELDRRLAVGRQVGS